MITTDPFLSKCGHLIRQALRRSPPKIESFALLSVHLHRYRRISYCQFANAYSPFPLDPSILAVVQSLGRCLMIYRMNRPLTNCISFTEPQCTRTPVYRVLWRI